LRRFAPDTGRNLSYRDVVKVNGYKIEPGSDLSDANLSDVNLSGANLSDVNLTGANLSGANLSGATMPLGTVNP